MKTIAFIIILAFTGCANYNPQLTRATVALGTKLGLEYGIKDPAQRTKVANYVNPAAAALYSFSGTPDTTNLTAQLQAYLPENVKEDLPQVMTIVVPLVATTYQQILDKYHVNALTDIAYGIQVGTAEYVTRK